MTEKKRLPEQMASHTYRKQALAHPSSRQPVSRDANRAERREARHTLQRVVTIPEADPSTAWNTFAQRQEKRRRARSRPVYDEETVPVAPRTYAQTGMRASNGRLKAVRRLPTHHSSPIPVRSGAQRQVKRGIFWRLLSLIFGIIALIFVANLVLNSNVFRVEHVNIVGTHNDVLVRSIQHMGMQRQNIFFMDFAPLKERIETSPRVASASLNKQWPNQVTVNVVERTPVLLWHTAQGTYSVDNQGVVIAPVSETPGANHLRTVIDTTGKAGNSGTIQPGVHLNQADIAFALDVLNRLPQVTGISNFTLRYSGTIYGKTDQQSGRSGSGGSYIVDSPDGWLAYLGGVDDTNPLDNRLIELQQILALVQQSHLATVDLRYGLRPVYTLKQ
jgi:hypothetical protein